ncbi:unnamed protein product [Clavelina lepadiformis]|uniref:Uncharacterized protein n=1 Tax=Clavelina lepadiformis TaxID=159417 RepID=A0ABP0FSJ1_CLALP
MSEITDRHLKTLSARIRNCEEPEENDKTSSPSYEHSFLDLSSQTSEKEEKPSNIHVFSASSTMHGFSHMFALHHSFLRKFVWGVAFVASFTLLLFQVSFHI